MGSNEPMVFVRAGDPLKEFSLFLRYDGGVGNACLRNRRGRIPLSWRVRYSSRATAKPGDSPKRSSRRALPLSKTRIDVLRLLASQRDPESYVAAATPLRRDALRYSGDTDVFHDREERFASAALSDAPALEAARYGVRWLRRCR